MNLLDSWHNFINEFRSCLWNQTTNVSQAIILFTASTATHFRQVNAEEYQIGPLIVFQVFVKSKTALSIMLKRLELPLFFLNRPIDPILWDFIKLLHRHFSLEAILRSHIFLFPKWVTIVCQDITLIKGKSSVLSFDSLYSLFKVLFQLINAKMDDN